MDCINHRCGYRLLTSSESICPSTMMKANEIKASLEIYRAFCNVFVCKIDDLPDLRRQNLKRGKNIFIVEISKTKKTEARWVAIFLDEKRNCFYMDREGIRPKHYRLITFIKSMSLFTVYNDHKLHYIHQYDSGTYVIKFINHMANFRPFDEFLYKFSQKYETV